MRKETLDNYIKAVTNGLTNGYGYLDSFTTAQIDILYNIIQSIRKEPITGGTNRDKVKYFTRYYSNKDSIIFVKYINNVALVYDDLLKAM